MGLEGTSSAGTNANCLSAIELAVELAVCGAGVGLATAVELTDTATATATGGGPGGVGNGGFLRHLSMKIWVF